MHKLRIHYLQHVPFEGLGSITEWVSLNGHELSSTQFFINSNMPEPDDIDWLIIMGGPMGVYDEEKYNWLASEKQLIKKAIEAGKTIIGVCLGAQLIAEVLEAKVYPNQYKEIGWYPLKLNPEALENNLFKGFAEKLTVFHWHGDTFDLPSNAMWLASSDACKNQAFLYNEKVLGLQFHFEMTEPALNEMIEKSSAELRPTPFIQTAEMILNNRNLIEDNKRALFTILDRLANQP
jgi:GMP synthase-like glutamine amidotransferase